MIGFTFAAALILASTASLNLTFDIFSDFYYLTGLRRQPPTSEDYYGERKYKAALVYHLDSGSIYSAVLGSSRIAALNPEDSQLSNDNGATYNLAFAGATVDQLLSFASQLATRHPNTILFVVFDFRGFSVRSLDRLYLQGLDHLPSAWDAFQRLIAGKTARQTMEWIKGPSRTRFSWLGVRPIPGEGQSAERLAETANKMKLSFAELAAYQYDLSAFDKVKSFASRHKKVTVFLTPVSAWYVDVLHAYGLTEAFATWQKAFASLPNCVDFTYNSSFSEDPQIFVDPHHVTPAAGNVLFDDLVRFELKENLVWGAPCAESARNTKDFGGRRRVNQPGAERK